MFHTSRTNDKLVGLPTTPHTEAPSRGPRRRIDRGWGGASPEQEYLGAEGGVCVEDASLLSSLPGGFPPRGAWGCIARVEALRRDQNPQLVFDGSWMIVGCAVCRTISLAVG